MARRWRSWAGAWTLGVGAAVAVLGPAYKSGSLLSLDLVFTPRLPVPTGAWGLGPDLPRRVPIGVPFAWLASAVGGELAGKLLLTACIAGAVAGAALLARRCGATPIAAAGAGLLYGLSPFALTRLGAGHWGLLAAMAVLPFAAPLLADPSDRAAAFLGAVALGLTGFAGGLFALTLGTCGLVVHRRRVSLMRGAICLLAAQLPWLVPGIVVATTATGPLRLATGFATRVNLLTATSLVAGDGFWRRSSQVGLNQAVTSAVGAGLLLLAVLGHRRLPKALRLPFVTAAGVASAIALASAVPIVRTGFEGLTAGLVSPLREGQRLLPLLFVWLAPACALAVDSIATAAARGWRPLVRTALAVVALILAGPGLWGVGGRLEPAQFPGGYRRAVQLVDAAPGSVLALPWHEYLNLSFAADRRVLNPLPDRFGGDVIASTDPELGEAHQEGADPRGPTAARVADDIRAGRAASQSLRALGIRWVVLMKEVDWRKYSAVDRDPGLSRIPVGDGVRVYRVDGWSGRVDNGRLDAFASPLARSLSTDEQRWFHPGQRGWKKGWTSARISMLGQLVLPGGRGIVWFWPAAVVLLADLGVAIGSLIAVRSLFDR